MRSASWSKPNLVERGRAVLRNPTAATRSAIIRRLFLCVRRETLLAVSEPPELGGLLSFARDAPAGRRRDRRPHASSDRVCGRCVGPIYAGSSAGSLSHRSAATPVCRGAAAPHRPAGSAHQRPRQRWHWAFGDWHPTRSSGESRRCLGDNDASTAPPARSPPCAGSTARQAGQRPALPGDPRPKNS